MMISTRHGFLYVHIPKTGGNAIQQALLPISDDRMKLSVHQDGRDRFEIVGPATPKKHATLEEYRSAGADLSSLEIVTSVRHPFDRALSFYFSPHRWAVQSESGEWQITSPVWDEAKFFEMLPQIASITSFFELDDGVIEPHYVLRHESLSSDFCRLVSHLALPIPPNLPVVNVSTANRDTIESLRQSAELAACVDRHFAHDMIFFGY